MSWSPTNRADAVWLFLFNPKAVPEFLSQRSYKHSLNKDAPRPALYNSAHPCCWGPCQAGHARPPAQLLLLIGKQQDPQGSNLATRNKAHILIIPDPNPPLTLFTNARLLGSTQPCFQMAVWTTGYLRLYREANRIQCFCPMTLLSNQMCTRKTTSRTETTMCTTAILNEKYILCEDLSVKK